MSDFEALGPKYRLSWKNYMRSIKAEALLLVEEKGEIKLKAPTKVPGKIITTVSFPFRLGDERYFHLNLDKKTVTIDYEAKLKDARWWGRSVNKLRRAYLG